MAENVGVASKMSSLIDVLLMWCVGYCGNTLAASSTVAPVTDCSMLWAGNDCKTSFSA